MQSNHNNHYVFNKLKQIPFVESENDIFVPDKEKLEPIFDEIHEEYDDYQELKDALYALQFTENELETYMTSNVELPTYTEWKRKLDDYILNATFDSDSQNMYRIVNERQSNQAQRTTSTEQVVLNKRNPFADVSISTQAFLYPGTKGYETLAFATNRHLVRKETEDGVFYAVVPGFKVTKTNEREQPDTIIASDSVSTKLPEKESEKRVVYLN